jgi:hypothetical protein
MEKEVKGSDIVTSSSAHAATAAQLFFARRRASADREKLQNSLVRHSEEDT